MGACRSGPVRVRSRSSATSVATNPWTISFLVAALTRRVVHSFRNSFCRQQSQNVPGRSITISAGVDEAFDLLSLSTQAEEPSCGERRPNRLPRYQPENLLEQVALGHLKAQTILLISEGSAPIT